MNAIGRVLTILVALVLSVVGLVPQANADDEYVTYTAEKTIPVPPAGSYQGSAGGDGWDISLSSWAVYNVFHHNSAFQVACHRQSDAAECYSPITVVDETGGTFSTPGHSTTWIDIASERLFGFATRNADQTAGVVCFDGEVASAGGDPFCGFTPLTAAGGSPLQPGSQLSAAVTIGSRVFSMNYSTGLDATGDHNTLLCFDTSEFAPCAGQPFSVFPGGQPMNSSTWPVPAVASIDGRVVVPLPGPDVERITCFDGRALAICGGAWPAVIDGEYAGRAGAAYPHMDDVGNTTGFCLPTNSAECYLFTGSSFDGPHSMSIAVAQSSGWNGGAVTVGTRVFVPNGLTDSVHCFNYETSTGCVGFPKMMAGLGLLYTVNSDPSRAGCMWVNADYGSHQIQNFDAYSGGGCGEGPIRVMASNIVAPSMECYPSDFKTLQVVSPDPSQYGTGTVDFVDYNGQSIPELESQELDHTGSVVISSPYLLQDRLLPQFLITLDAAEAAVAVTVRLTWSGRLSEECVLPGIEVGDGAGLNIDASISDYDGWVDPTKQPLIVLRLYVTGPDGMPATGAQVRLSTANATFTIPESGQLRLVQPVGKGASSSATVTAAQGDLRGSRDVLLFESENLGVCWLPGEPKRLDTLGNIMDTLLPSAPAGKLGRAAETLMNWLGAVNTASSILPEERETVGEAWKYTGDFTPIYGLSVAVIDKDSRETIKALPSWYSRNSELHTPLFEGSGSLVDRIGRNMVCGRIA